MAYFYGVSPRNRGLQVFLGLLRFVSEPDAVRFPHITLRGPHERKLERSRLDALNNVVRHHPRVQILTPEKFFSGSQNTVVLLVDIRDLRQVWYKPHYPGGEAHITLYDGENRSHAQLILNAMRQYEWAMNISVGPLTLLEPKISEKHGFLRQAATIYRAYERFRLTDYPALDEVPQLSFTDRLSIFKALLERSELTKISADALLHA